MSDTAISHFPMIVLPGLEGNPPIETTPLQAMLQPYALGIQAGWWLCFGITALFLLARFFVFPLYLRWRR